jgi:pilus assembly protein CpaF
MRVIERIVAPIGRRIDEGVPMVDGRLPDGSRVNAIIPPLSLIGPILTIRRFAGQRYSMTRLVEIGALTASMAEFLKVCVQYRKNIIVSGGTGTGKTTFLNALSEHISSNERIVTIEDAAELRLAQPHVLSLEARPPNVEGRGEVSIRDLVRNALRMRPDRIVVGECRGGEALDMLQAMNTGHDGSLTTGHANSPRDLLSRLEVMVLMAGMELPVRAIREQIASAVDIIVQLSRFSDGRRRVTSIVAVEGLEGDVILTQPLFNFRQKGVGARGAVLGSYQGCGQAPAFYEALQETGICLDRAVFAETQEQTR